MPRTVSVQPTAHVVNITLAGGDKTFRTIVKVENRNTREFKEYVADENNVACNLADLSSTGDREGTISGWSDGDVIEIRCHGGRMGSGTLTVDADVGRTGAKVTITVIDGAAARSPVISV